MTRFVYYSQDLRFWTTGDAHIAEGRCAVADRMTQADEDKTRTYIRLTSYRWSLLRDVHPAATLAPIRQALVDLYGEAKVAASESQPSKRAA